MSPANRRNNETRGRPGFAHLRAPAGASTLGKKDLEQAAVSLVCVPKPALEPPHNRH